MTSTNDIRRSFLDFFTKNGHERVPSAPLVPHNDPTLMFVNAGMVPFKNVFTGLETRSYSTATSSQKCVRAGGKHNDLDNVGYTARHHTFFEMLGNFSFGDYFKDRAIELAWTLVTKEWGLDPERLTATVYHTDDEAFGLWKKIAGLPESRIIKIPTKDNFWAMGDDGPCGPCSEIFYDHGEHIPGGPPGSPDEDGDRFVEIWNLVFMQYEQSAGEIVSELPSKSIDTGMGLERIAAVLQGVPDNYDTDLFRALIEASEELTHTKAQGDNKASHRVIADHLRASGFLVADGVLPANEGRGYVLRRIMRRAMRHAHLLGSKEPLMHRLVPALVAEMGAAYPELLRAQPLIEATLKQEETRFRQTLATGLKLLDEATADLGEGGTLSGETAFKLYDTYGFPFDLTEDALRARGLAVDHEGFDAAMAKQKAAARAAWKGSGETTSDEMWFDLAEEFGSTEFTGYSGDEGEGVVLAMVRDGQRVESAEVGQTVQILLNQTPFYGESGGQVGDSGKLTNLKGFEGDVEDTTKPLGRLHVLRTRIVAGELSLGDVVQQKVDSGRRDRVRANHSATHLLHAALRHRLGTHVTQKGSLVAPDHFRFDFSHPQAMSRDDIEAVEAEVNAQIRGNQPVTTRLMSPDEAIEAGAMALFGEKYGEEVRVLSMGRTSDGDYSVELCGGTHVRALGDIQLLKITSESAVSSGVRRIEALTGEAARQWLNEREARLREAAATLKSAPDEVPARIAALVDERKRLERELADAKKALATGGGKSEGPAAEKVGGYAFLGQVVEGLNPKDLRSTVDEMKQKLGSGVGAIVAVNDGRASVAVGVTDDLAKQVSAVDLVKAAVAKLGGQGGGGRPDMAQGGGPDGSTGERSAAGGQGRFGKGAGLSRSRVPKTPPPEPARLFLQVRFLLDAGAQLVALLMNRRDYRSHRDAEIDQRRFGKLERCLERFGDRVGHPRLVKPRRVRRVAGAGDDRQVGKRLSKALREARHEHGIVHGEDERRRLSTPQALDQPGLGNVAVDRRIAFAGRGHDRIDVGIDRDIVLRVRVEHLRDHSTDPAEAENNDFRRSARLKRLSHSSRHFAVDPAGGGAPERGQERCDGQADRGDDLPEGCSLRQDQGRCGRRSKDDERGLRRGGHQHSCLGGHSAPCALQTEEAACYHRLHRKHAHDGDRDFQPVPVNEPHVDAHPDGDEENAEAQAANRCRHDFNFAAVIGFRDDDFGDQRAKDRGKADCGGNQARDDHHQQAGGKEQLRALGSGGLGEEPREKEAAREQHRNRGKSPKRQRQQKRPHAPARGIGRHCPQREHDRNQCQVFKQEHRQRRPADRASGAGKGDHQRRGRQCECEAKADRARPALAHQVEDERDDRRRDKQLGSADSENQPPHVPQAAEREFQPDGEQEQDDSQLCEGGDRIPLRNGDE